MKFLIAIILISFSAVTFACKCIPGDMDKWFSDSIEVIYIKVVGTSLEADPERDGDRVKIQYEVTDRFKGKVADSGFAYEGLHNCSLGVKAGAKYIFYIRDHRIISRCGGSQMIYDWTDKGKQILEQLRAKSLNKSKHADLVKLSPFLFQKSRQLNQSSV